MLIFKTLASITIVSVASLGGINILANAAGYPKHYQVEAEQACLSKKMSELDAQQAPVKSLTSTSSFSSKE